MEAQESTETTLMQYKFGSDMRMQSGYELLVRSIDEQGMVVEVVQTSDGQESSLMLEEVAGASILKSTLTIALAAYLTSF